MAIRQLGSSLVAKSTPGSRYRDIGEAQVVPPGENQGEPGSLSRVQAEEPLNRAVSPGSAKTISVKPLLEPTLPGDQLGKAGIPFTESFGAPAGQGGAGKVIAPVQYVAPQPQAQPQGNQGGGDQGGGQPGQLRSQAQAQAQPFAQPVFRSQAQPQAATKRPTVTKVGGRTIAQNPKGLRSLA